MFDLSWGKMLIIGVMALVLIPPKDLPATLRALGQMVGKLKRMAGEFRAQFDDAMREADIASVKKEFESMGDTASSVSTFNPIESIRNEIKSAVQGDTAASTNSQITSSVATADPVMPLPEAAPPVDSSHFAETSAPPAPAAETATPPAAANEPLPLAPKKSAGA